MSIKAIIVLIIFLLFTVPLLFQTVIWSVSSVVNPSPENIQKGGELIAEAAVPWWVGIMEWMAGLGGTVAAVLIIGFIFFLKWIGEIR
jgi:hypothetical protein